ncbi:MAG: ABC transporter ATP-binding protein [Balneolaceae bacterium]
MTEIMEKAILQVQKVTKQYRAGKVVFTDISETFYPGDAVLLKGPNGSGKTTFLKLLSVNTFPTGGSVFYGDLDIHRYPYRYLKNVGLVHDEEALPQHLSAVELLTWILHSRGLRDEESVKEMTGIFEHLELDDARYDEIGTYSTGMKKKTQIAAALICKPAVLILDEPLRGLDRSSTGRTLDLFRSAVSRGALILMASHARADEDDLFKRVMTFPL